MMNAAVYHRFGGPISLERVPIPICPRDGVLIQVKATGVCRSDWHGWKGHDKDITMLPFTPGHEFSGVVVQVGSDVVKSSALRVGDRVAVPFILSCGECRYCDSGRPTVCSRQEQPGFTFCGSFAEYVAIPRAARNVRQLPDAVSHVQAAALGCRFTTAYRALYQQGPVTASDTVAIFGCGGLGLSCVMLAKAAGVSAIIAVDINDASLNKARELGATHIVNIRGLNQEEVCSRVRTFAADGDGADITIDAAGFASTCENAVYCTRPAGRMVQVGLPIGEKNAPQIPMGLIAAKEIEIVGSHGFAADDLPNLLDLVASGRFDPSQLIEQRVTLLEGARAIEDMDMSSPLGITMVTDFGSKTSTRSRL